MEVQHACRGYRRFYTPCPMRACAGERMGGGRGRTTHPGSGEGVVGVLHVARLGGGGPDAVGSVGEKKRLVVREGLLGAAALVAPRGRQVPCLLLGLRPARHCCTTGPPSRANMDRAPFRFHVSASMSCRSLGRGCACLHIHCHRLCTEMPRSAQSGVKGTAAAGESSGETRSSGAGSPGCSRCG